MNHQALMFKMLITFAHKSINTTNNSRWIQDVAFDVDITEHLTQWNLKLQGKEKTVTYLHDDIKCFMTKLNLWKTQMQNKNLGHFPFLKDVKSKLQDTDNELDIEKWVSNINLFFNEFKSTFLYFVFMLRQICIILSTIYI